MRRLLSNWMLSSARTRISLMRSRTSWTISKLVQEVLDLISEILVLALDNIQLLNSLLMSSPQAEEFAVEVAALLLAGINFSRDIFSLGLPFADDLVKVAATLLSDDSGSVDTFVLHGDILQVSLHP